MMSLNITIVTENNIKAQLNYIQNIHLTSACDDVVELKRSEIWKDLQEKRSDFNTA